MPVKNEIQYIEAVNDLLINSADEIQQILVIDDGSEDGTLETLQEYERKFPNLILYQNVTKFDLNNLICFLLSKVETKYVHLRTPHDFYDRYFYPFHLERLNRHQGVLASFSRVNYLSDPKSEIGLNLSLGPISSSLLSRGFDLNFSSCGFVCDAKLLRELWTNYSDFELDTDWWVKKEIIFVHRHLISFKVLSSYNDIKINQLSMTILNNRIKNDLDLLQLPFIRLRDKSHLLKFFSFPYQTYYGCVIAFTKNFPNNSFRLMFSVWYWFSLNFTKKLVKRLIHLIR